MLVVDSRWLSCLDLSLSSIVQPCWIKPRKSDSAVLGIREEKNSMKPLHWSCMVQLSKEIQ